MLPLLDLVRRPSVLFALLERATVEDAVEDAKGKGRVSDDLWWDYAARRERKSARGARDG